MAHDASQPPSAMGVVRTIELPQGTIEHHDEGTGRPIVFLHGLALTAAFWRHVAPPLSTGHRCITPTLPLGGHAYPMDADADLTPEGLADLIADLLERLELRDAVLVSNDTATALAQVLVTRRPERVGGLVLTSGDAFGHFLPWQFRHLQVAARLPEVMRAVALNLQGARLRRSVLGYGLLTRRGIADDVSAAYVRNLAQSGVRADLTKVLTGISTRYTRAAARRLPAFAKPTLLVWARQDVLFPVKDAHRLAALLPDAQVEVVDDSRTYIPEDQPEALVALVRTFVAIRLAGLEPAPPPGG